MAAVSFFESACRLLPQSLFFSKTKKKYHGFQTRKEEQMNVPCQNNDGNMLLQMYFFSCIDAA
jgi:hypothetical protein